MVYGHEPFGRCLRLYSYDRQSNPPPGRPGMSPTTASSARVPSATLLNEEMLARFARRASDYDRENRFFSEDFEELRDCGYLRAAVPRDFGGGGLSLAEVMRQQRRL